MLPWSRPITTHQGGSGTAAFDQYRARRSATLGRYAPSSASTRGGPTEARCAAGPRAAQRAAATARAVVPASGPRGTRVGMA